MLSVVSVQAATYHSANGELSLPSLIDGSKTLIDVIIKLDPDGSYTVKGTEATLPFQCPGIFSQSTHDLIKSATSLASINSLLRCQWSFQTQASIDATQNSPVIISSTTTWLDSTCAPLVVSMSDFSGSPTIQSSSVTLNNAGCNTGFGFVNSYDLKTNAFLISSVIIDDSVVATELVIKFTENNRYELINFALTPRAVPPVVCRTLTDADFNSISSDMSPDDINTLLNCQWRHKLVSGSSVSPLRLKNFAWIDHECNEILMTEGQNTVIFSQHKTAGCRSFNAR